MWKSLKSVMSVAPGFPSTASPAVEELFISTELFFEMKIPFTLELKTVAFEDARHLREYSSPVTVELKTVMFDFLQSIPNLPFISNEQSVMLNEGLRRQ